MKSRPSVTARLARPLVLGALGAALCLRLAAGQGAGAAPSASDLERLERELLLLVEGDAVPVQASPALCAAHGERVLGFVPGTNEWFFGNAACEVVYPPNPATIVTEATIGMSKRLFESPALTARLNQTLDDLRLAVAAAPPAPVARLRIHTTAWELAVGLKRSLDHHPERAAPLRDTVCKSFDLLRQTRFSPAEIAALPATLAELPRLAATPELAGIVEAILRRDPNVVEVYPSTDSHAQALLGRFAPRIFLALTDGSPRLREFLGGKPADLSLLHLPQEIGGLVGVLVLYFNVLTEGDAVATTEHVAVVQHYEFAGKTSFDLPFDQAAKLLRFSTVMYERGHPAGGYRKLSPQATALRGFVDAKPGSGGIPATTLRGNCLSCHLYRVETFNTHALRRADFTAPLAHPPADLVAGYTLKIIQPEIRRELQRCAADRGQQSAREQATP